MELLFGDYEDEAVKLLAFDMLENLFPFFECHSFRARFVHLLRAGEIHEVKFARLAAEGQTPVKASRPADFLYRRAEGSPRLDHTPGRNGAGGRRGHPHRFPAWLYQGGSH